MGREPICTPLVHALPRLTQHHHPRVVHAGGHQLAPQPSHVEVLHCEEIHRGDDDCEEDAVHDKQRKDGAPNHAFHGLEDAELGGDRSEAPRLSPVRARARGTSCARRVGAGCAATVSLLRAPACTGARPSFDSRLDILEGVSLAQVVGHLDPGETHDVLLERSILAEDGGDL